MSRTRTFLTALALGGVLLGLGAAGGWWWATQTPAVAVPMHKAPEQAQGEVLYWYDPMFPQQHFDQPGKSPFMDMQLVPRYAESASAAAPAGVTIDPAVAQNLGTRLAKVERLTLALQTQASGIVGFDERDVAILQSRTAGFVERVWPLAPGDVVVAGQPLLELLVPEWTAAQHELLAVAGSGDAALLAAARERLTLLGMPPRLIHQVEQTGRPRSRHTVTALIGGAVQALEVRAGMTVAAGQTLARINGLAKVWVEVAVPESQTGQVQVGDAAQVYLVSAPQQAIGAYVVALLPSLDQATRSLRVRLELPNPDRRLRPGLSARVVLAGAGKHTALALPTEAIIRTGKRALVMLAGEQGRFQPVEVRLGAEIGDLTVITAGLHEGQQVVASGQFLIDSEASLLGIPAGATPPTPPLGAP